MMAADEYRDRVLTKLILDSSRVKAENVLATAHETCIRSATNSSVARLAHSRATHKYHSLIRLQYGDSSFAVSGDGEDPDSDEEISETRPAAGSRLLPPDAVPGASTSSASTIMPANDASNVLDCDANRPSRCPTGPNPAAGTAASQMLRASSSCQNWRKVSRLLAASRRRKSAPDTEEYVQAAAAAATSISAAHLTAADDDSDDPFSSESSSWVQRAASLTAEHPQHSSVSRLHRGHLLHLIHNNADPAAVVAAALGDVPTDVSTEDEEDADDSSYTGVEQSGEGQFASNAEADSNCVQRPSLSRLGRSSNFASFSNLAPLAPPSPSFLTSATAAQQQQQSLSKRTLHLQSFDSASSPLRALSTGGAPAHSAAPAPLSADANSGHSEECMATYHAATASSPDLTRQQPDSEAYMGSFPVASLRRNSCSMGSSDRGAQHHPAHLLGRTARSLSRLALAPGQSPASSPQSFVMHATPPSAVAASAAAASSGTASLASPATAATTPTGVSSAGAFGSAVPLSPSPFPSAALSMRSLRASGSSFTAHARSYSTSSTHPMDRQMMEDGTWSPRQHNQQAQQQHERFTSHAPDATLTPTSNSRGCGPLSPALPDSHMAGRLLPQPPGSRDQRSTSLHGYIPVTSQRSSSFHGYVTSGSGGGGGSGVGLQLTQRSGSIVWSGTPSGSHGFCTASEGAGGAAPGLPALGGSASFSLPNSASACPSAAARLAALAAAQDRSSPAPSIADEVSTSGTAIIPTTTPALPSPFSSVADPNTPPGFSAAPPPRLSPAPPPGAQVQQQRRASRTRLPLMTPPPVELPCAEGRIAGALSSPRGPATSRPITQQQQQEMYWSEHSDRRTGLPLPHLPGSSQQHHAHLRAHSLTGLGRSSVTTVATAAATVSVHAEPAAAHGSHRAARAEGSKASEGGAGGVMARLFKELKELRRREEAHTQPHMVETKLSE